MSQLVRHYGCSLVLCTATQPSVNRILAEEEMLGAVPVTELCPEPGKMYELFRRVTYRQAGTLSDETLAARLAVHSQVLCIVNKKRHARALYELLPEEGRYHLSTLMTPNDRARTLDEIRSRLSEGLPCRVVSTSLIEAGVDVDFPAVYRERAGLDSLIQAAGRCNREGKRSAENSPVYLFRPEKETLPADLMQNASATDYVLRQCEDIASLEAIREYFDFLLYQLKGDTMLDQKQIMKTIRQNPMQFAEVSDAFHLIEEEDCTVVIPNERTGELLNVIEHSGIRRGMLRILGQDSVSVPSYIYSRLEAEGAIRPLDSSGNTAVLYDESRYHPDCGLDLSAQEMQALNW